MHMTTNQKVLGIESHSSPLVLHNEIQIEYANHFDVVSIDPIFIDYIDVPTQS